MERVALTALVREKAGKGVARGLRREQRVPAVLYSHGKSMPISMVSRDVTKILNTEGGEHALINLTLEGAQGSGEHMALIKDYQVDPLNGSLIHLDLMEVAMNEKVKIQVSVHITGSSIGVKEGGIFQYGLRTLEVECLPTQIPDNIEVNITNLKINESLHVRDITAPEGVRILSDGDSTVATIQPPISAEKLESMLAAAPTAEVGEPEVVGKKKEGEAEAAAAPAAGAKGKEAAPAKEAAAPKKEAAPKK
ncbi:MAG: 50S ribosomal protein L25 [Nitrospirae bacterium]|nr:50S ribosomal protein L25 [Nitrospirota bacterium]NTW66022.1 50S ribosomal protein L25 [Nitrospirota bacterium]